MGDTLSFITRRRGSSPSLRLTTTLAMTQKRCICERMLERIANCPMRSLLQNPRSRSGRSGKDKDGFDIDVLGVAPGITLPKSDPTMACNPVPEHQADNLYLIPNITELARAATNGTNRGEITKDRRRFLNRVHLEGGDVVFRRASSCFEVPM